MIESTRLERIIDLPRSIVWDALVDPVLAEGWLHPEAQLVDGVEVIDRRDPAGLAASEPAVLESLGAQLGHTRFEVSELPGGTRGSVTRVELALPELPDERIRVPVIAGWQTRLDQLEELLRGNPVDWENWARDHGAAYESHLLRAVNFIQAHGRA